MVCSSPIFFLPVTGTRVIETEENIPKSCWNFLVMIKRCGGDRLGGDLESLQLFPQGYFISSALMRFSLILPESLAERIQTTAIGNGVQSSQDIYAKIQSGILS